MDFEEKNGQLVFNNPLAICGLKMNGTEIVFQAQEKLWGRPLSVIKEEGSDVEQDSVGHSRLPKDQSDPNLLGGTPLQDLTLAPVSGSLAGSTESLGVKKDSGKHAPVTQEKINEALRSECVEQVEEESNCSDDDIPPSYTPKDPFESAIKKFTEEDQKIIWYVIFSVQPKDIDDIKSLVVEVGNSNNFEEERGVLFDLFDKIVISSEPCSPKRKPLTKDLFKSDFELALEKLSAEQIDVVNRCTEVLENSECSEVLINKFKKVVSDNILNEEDLNLAIKLLERCLNSDNPIGMLKFNLEFKSKESRTLESELNDSDYSQCSEDEVDAIDDVLYYLNDESSKEFFKQITRKEVVLNKESESWRHFIKFCKFIKWDTFKGGFVEKIIGFHDDGLGRIDWKHVNKILGARQKYVDLFDCENKKFFEERVLRIFSDNKKKTDRNSRHQINSLYAECDHVLGKSIPAYNRKGVPNINAILPARYAVKIQSLWRGYKSRKEMVEKSVSKDLVSDSINKVSAVLVIQKAWLQHQQRQLISLTSELNRKKEEIFGVHKIVPDVPERDCWGFFEEMRKLCVNDFERKHFDDICNHLSEGEEMEFEAYINKECWLDNGLLEYDFEKAKSEFFERFIINDFVFGKALSGFYEEEQKRILERLLLFAKLDEQEAFKNCIILIACSKEDWQKEILVGTILDNGLEVGHMLHYLKAPKPRPKEVSHHRESSIGA